MYNLPMRRPRTKSPKAGDKERVKSPSAEDTMDSTSKKSNKN